LKEVGKEKKKTFEKKKAWDFFHFARKLQKQHQLTKLLRWNWSERVLLFNEDGINAEVSN